MITDVYESSARDYGRYVQELEGYLEKVKGTAEEAEIKRKLRRARINLTRSRNVLAQREATAAMLDRIARQRAIS